MQALASCALPQRCQRVLLGDEPRAVIAWEVVRRARQAIAVQVVAPSARQLSAREAAGFLLQPDRRVSNAPIVPPYGGVPSQGAQIVSNRHHRDHGYRMFGGLAALLLLLIPCTGAWAQGKGPPAEDTRQRGAAKGLRVVVQAGQLTVDVQDADLGEVLAQIGRQAGIRISSVPSSGQRISARFAGVRLRICEGGPV
jgi:hypothetical protein